MPSDLVPADTRLRVVGVPGTRRVQGFLDAAARAGFRDVELVSYQDVLAGRCALPMAGTLIRLESPSECAATTRAILRLGIAPLAEAGGVPLSTELIDEFCGDRGEMLAPRQWFFGYREALREWQATWDECDVHWMLSPECIARSFDKRACLEGWSAADLPVPPGFLGIQNYSQLRDELRVPAARLFIKLRYGYSALGAMTVEWRGPLARAITMMEVTTTAGKPRFFLTKRPRVLQDESEIAWLFDQLAQQEIIVERWLPKARWRGLPFDLRVLVTGGSVRHVIGRANSAPFTNLNLDARRIDRADVQELLGAGWDTLEELCRRAAAVCAGTNHISLDVLVRPHCRRFVLLEANAFGDYLPRALHAGRTTYDWELADYCLEASGAGA